MPTLAPDLEKVRNIVNSCNDRNWNPLGLSSRVWIPLERHDCCTLLPPPLVFSAGFRCNLPCAELGLVKVGPWLHPLWLQHSPSERPWSVFYRVGTLSGKQAAEFLWRFGLCSFFYGYQVGFFYMFKNLWFVSIIFPYYICDSLGNIIKNWEILCGKLTPSGLRFYPWRCVNNTVVVMLKRKFTCNWYFTSSDLLKGREMKTYQTSSSVQVHFYFWFQSLIVEKYICTSASRGDLCMGLNLQFYRNFTVVIVNGSFPCRAFFGCCRKIASSRYHFNDP